MDLPKKLNLHKHLHICYSLLLPMIFLFRIPVFNHSNHPDSRLIYNLFDPIHLHNNISSSIMWHNSFHQIYKYGNCDEGNMEFYGSEAKLTKVKPWSILLQKIHKTHIA